MKGDVEITQSFFRGLGFLLLWRRNELRHPQSMLNMKLFFSISFLTHLAFFSMASVLFLNAKMDSLPALHVEVTLYPWTTEEKQAKVSIKKEEKEIFSPPSPAVEVKENPLREAPSPSTEVKREEISDEEEQAEEKPFVLASLNPETVSTIRRESSSETLPPVSQIPSAQEEAKQVAKYPSLSEGEVVLVHPKYAENPKPLYPQEARKKGFQGEVVLKVEVLSNGLVGQVEVKKSSGHEILDRSALSAVKQWKFFPAKRGESATASWVSIPIKFQLQ